MLSNLEEMGLSPDTALQRSQDRMTGAREVGAPGSVRKELTADYNNEVKTENLRQKEAARDARDAAREAEREASQARVFAQQDKIQGKQHSATLAAIGARGSGGGGGRDEDNTREQMAFIKAEKQGLRTEMKTLEDRAANPSMEDRRNKNFLEDVKAERTRLKNAMDALAPQEKVVQDRLFPGAKPVVPGSTVKDNPTTSKGITQAEYVKLPSGARYTAPDGTIRTKK
jgi:hypothetical protein